MLPNSIAALIAALNKLPGVGPRSAERMALHLVQLDSAAVRQLADAILLAREKIQFCATCGASPRNRPVRFATIRAGTPRSSAWSNALWTF